MESGNMDMAWVVGPSREVLCSIPTDVLLMAPMCDGITVSYVATLQFTPHISAWQCFSSFGS